MKEQFYSYIQQLQNRICKSLEEQDGNAVFKEDKWERPGGGGGYSRVLEGGSVFEKAGVNISKVYGPLAKPMQDYFKVGEVDFFACGLSLVIHPFSPLVPTVHANWRYFEMYNKSGEKIDAWFGGGQDLTPYYLFEEDAFHFHKVCKQACDAHGANLYSSYKAQCDGYFWNHHRAEARGIGGLFFDYLKPNDTSTIEDWFAFIKEVGDSFIKAYIPIVQKRKALAFSESQRKWQEIRRGRYVEFNLLHDKGTLFGLKTDGRIESILMSLPPVVQWHYNYEPFEGSEERKLVEVLKKPRAWI